MWEFFKAGRTLQHLRKWKCPCRALIDGRRGTMMWVKTDTATGKTVWRFLKKLKIELAYDPAIPLLGIYPEKSIIQNIHAPPSNVHCSTFCDRSYMEATQVSVERGMDNEDVARICKWNSTRSWKGMKQGHLQRRGWSSRLLHRVK